MNETQLVDAIDQLLTEEQTDGPTPPPVDSIDAFGERLLRAIKVAAALKNTDRDAALPNVTEGDTKAQKRVIMRALLKDLSKVEDRPTCCLAIARMPLCYSGGHRAVD